MADLAGGLARRPLGLVVVGGLLVSQMLTLSITPVIDLYFERMRERRASAAKPAPVPAHASAD